jgi:Flp pilus assembly protein TadB
MSLNTTSNNTSSFTTNVANNLKTYRNNTFNLNNFNEIYSTNRYLDKATTEEKNRLSESLNRLKSSLMKMRQEYLVKKYTIEEYTVRVRVLQWTVIAICALFILLGLVLNQTLGPKLLMIIASAVIFVYAVIVYVIIKQNSYRFDNNWDMFYWGPITKRN